MKPVLILFMVIACSSAVNVDNKDKPNLKIVNYLSMLLKNHKDFDVLQSRSPEQSTGCMVCEFVVADMIYQLDSNKTSTEYFPWIEKKICTALFPPKGMNQLVTLYCEKILDLVLVEMVHLINSNVKPVAFCTKMTLCKSKRKAAELL